MQSQRAKPFQSKSTNQTKIFMSMIQQPIKLNHLNFIIASEKKITLALEMYTFQNHCIDKHKESQFSIHYNKK